MDYNKDSDNKDTRDEDKAIDAFAERVRAFRAARAEQENGYRNITGEKDGDGVS